MEMATAKNRVFYFLQKLSHLSSLHLILKWEKDEPVIPDINLKKSKIEISWTYDIENPDLEINVDSSCEINVSDNYWTSKLFDGQYQEFKFGITQKDEGAPRGEEWGDTPTPPRPEEISCLSCKFCGNQILSKKVLSSISDLLPYSNSHLEFYRYHHLIGWS
jgi:hypothetical protein